MPDEEVEIQDDTGRKLTRAELDKRIDARIKARYTCPACKTEDTWNGKRCTECGVVLGPTGRLEMPSAQKARHEQEGDDI